MIPTKRFWWLLAAGVPVAAVAVQIGAPGLAIAYDGLAFVVAFLTVILAPSLKGLRVRRRSDSVLSVRAPNRIVLEVTNDGAETVDGLIREEAPPQFEATNLEFRVAVPPGKTLDLTYYLTPTERGDDFFRGVVFRQRCPFGLAYRQVRLAEEEPLRVYPNVLALREFNLLKQTGRLKDLGIRRSRSRGLGTEFESLRDYAEGDDYRKIDWKATARRGKVVVRQFEQERNQAVILCVDVGRHMLAESDGVNKLDRALDACLMLANAAAVAGDMIGLLVFADDVRRYIPPRRGRSQLGIIVDAIHDLVAEPVESNVAAAFGYLSTRWKRRTLLVLFTDAGDADRAKELVTALAPLSRRHLVLVARISDPNLAESLRAPVNEPKTLYRRAAGLLLDADRRNATANLVAAHIRSLEAEPQDLSAALVTCYLDIKERSLL